VRSSLIRSRSWAASSNSSRFAADPAFRLDAESLAGLLKPERFVGRAPAQVDEFLAEHVRPWLAIHPPSLPDEEAQV